MLIFADKHTQSMFHDVIHHEARLESGSSTMRLLREYIIHRCLLFGNDGGMSLVELYTSGTYDDSLCRDFDFCLYSIPVDEYGVPELTDRTKWHKIFSGGIINHGTSNEPQWGMHT